MSARRRALFVALTALAVATVTDAKAEDRSTGASSAAFASLPSGKVPLPPNGKAPSTIPGNEKVVGFLVVRNGDYVTVVSSAMMAKQVNEGFRDDSSPAGGACFTGDQPLMRRAGGDEGELTWRADMEPVLTMSTSFARGQHPSVTAVHSERIAEEAGGASLEVVDAWVDPVTRGVRLIARSSVPLALVSTLLGGTKLFAARESQSVHVILVTPKVQRSSGQSRIFATVDNTVFNSSCDHMRATLKTEKGQGQTASFVSDVELPSLEPKDPREVKPDVTNGMRLAGARTEARVRPIHVHASVTWPSREKEPLLSVSAGWDSRERATP